MVKQKKSGSLVFEFVRYAEIETLSTQDRIKKVISIVKENKILLLEGRLRKQEEAQLIQKTMESIDNKFKGIELAVIDPTKEGQGLFSKIRGLLASVLLGERDGFTLIGPATIIREVKHNPQKINQLSIDLAK
jgi:hypothetical protein